MSINYGAISNDEDDPPPPYSPGPTPRYFDEEVPEVIPPRRETPEVTTPLLPERGRRQHQRITEATLLRAIIIRYEAPGGRRQQQRVTEARPIRYDAPGVRTPLLPERRRLKRRFKVDLGIIFLVFCMLLLLGIVITMICCLINWAMKQPYERRIAIIGAGPAGVSTAYHLAQRADSARIPHRITLYDKRSHIGGRSVHPVDIFSPNFGESVELGATTFPKSASILVKAADNLGLRTVAVHEGIGDLVGKGSGSFGVYDGRSWAYTEPHPRNFLESGWWTFWLWVRYGMSPNRAADIVSDFRKKRARLSSFIPFNYLSTAINSADLSQHATETAEHYLSSRGVAENFQREIFNPWIRGRYAQNLGTISGVGAFTAADNNDALSIYGENGMAGLWERMVSSSGASVNLETSVQWLAKGSWGGWFLASSSPSGVETVERFDAVVLATPWVLTSLNITLENTPHNVSYAPQHYTLFTSPHELSSNAFSGQKGIPGLILTTPCSWEYREISGGTGKDGMGHAPFWVLSRVKEVIRWGRREYVYKVVSAEELKDEEIHRMLGGTDKTISWVYRHFSPAAHPLLQPRTIFSDILLDDNLWYTGAMDELSTGVEMGSLMGNNVAALVVQRWMKEGKYLPEERRIPQEPEGETGGEKAS